MLFSESIQRNCIPQQTGCLTSQETPSEESESTMSDVMSFLGALTSSSTFCLCLYRAFFCQFPSESHLSFLLSICVCVCVYNIVKYDPGELSAVLPIFNSCSYLSFSVVIQCRFMDLIHFVSTSSGFAKGKQGVCVLHACVCLTTLVCMFCS